MNGIYCALIVSTMDILWIFRTGPRTANITAKIMMKRIIVNSIHGIPQASPQRM